MTILELINKLNEKYGLSIPQIAKASKVSIPTIKKAKIAGYPLKLHCLQKLINLYNEMYREKITFNDIEDFKLW